MKPRRKGSRWEINYRCPGYSKSISERFDTYEEAKARIAEIEYEKENGVLRPPVKSRLASSWTNMYSFMALIIGEILTSLTTDTVSNIISSPISALCCSVT